MKKKKDAPAKDPCWLQQKHRGCGGDIVAVALNGALALACRTCAELWRVESPYIPSDVNAPPEFEDVSGYIVRMSRKPTATCAKER